MAKLILIIDDAVTVRNLANYALTRANYKVIEAEDGQKALEKLAKNKVDMIISDYNMPVMDGLQMVSNIKQDPKLKSIPIFMLTSEATPDLLKQGKELGITGWILKPFVPDKLIEAVKIVLKD
jgi:two-component system chemotaxis response regulator CheY